jgi:hypothetical protein
MVMDVNIEIYLRQLKEFFEKDEQAKADMFSTLDVDMTKFFDLVRLKAEENFEKDGEPMLSGQQMADIMAMMIEGITEPELKVVNMDKIFKTIIEGYPPMCMN